MASENVRLAVAKAADSLSSRCASKPLDEKLGAKDWLRVRTEWEADAEAAGQDFLKALKYTGNIERAADYADALVLVDTDQGAPGSVVHPTRRSGGLWSGRWCCASRRRRTVFSRGLCCRARCRCRRHRGRRLSLSSNGSCTPTGRPLALGRDRRP